MENISSFNRVTASSCNTLPYAGLPQQQLTATGGNLGGYVNSQPQPYTYYYYVPSCAPAPVKPTAAELIALYKKEFGKDWKRMFAATVRIEAR